MHTNIVLILVSSLDEIRHSASSKQMHENTWNSIKTQFNLLNCFELFEFELFEFNVISYDFVKWLILIFIWLLQIEILMQ